jgi:hypothetical protein
MQKLSDLVNEKYKTDKTIVSKENSLPKTKLEENTYLRKFSSDTDSGEYFWHRDHEDRIVESINQTDWLVQIDNQLPQELNNHVFIPKGVYHRVIKGTGDLEIKVEKLF